ncbi:MAG: HlyD family efflux transporter periplasmic adaptor subunit [Clostridia bacterium]
MSQTNQTNQPANKRKKKKKWLWIILALLLATAVVLALLSGGSKEHAYAQEAAGARDLSTYYSFSGNLTPIQDEVQTAKTSLKVKELYVQEGDLVNEGDALLRGFDGTRIYAGYKGTVEELYPVADDMLQPGSQIARIVDYQALEVSIDVDEYDIGAVSLGKEGTVFINAIDRSISGAVSDIARSATIEGGVSYYPVKMQVEAQPDVLSGMSVEVNILNQQALGAVSVGLKAIAYDEYNKPYVSVRGTDGKLHAQYVETGVSDGQNIQILSGLALGDTVYYREGSMVNFYAMQQEMKDARSTVMGSD